MGGNSKMLTYFLGGGVLKCLRLLTGGRGGSKMAEKVLYGRPLPFGKNYKMIQKFSYTIKVSDFVSLYYYNNFIGQIS